MSTIVPYSICSKKMHINCIGFLCFVFFLLVLFSCLIACSLHLTLRDVTCPETHVAYFFYFIFPDYLCLLERRIERVGIPTSKIILAPFLMIAAIFIFSAFFFVLRKK